jgi:hypothetical protein
MDVDAIEQQRLLAQEEFQRKLIARDIEKKQLENEALEKQIQMEDWQRFTAMRQSGANFAMIARVQPAYIPFFPGEDLSEKEKADYETIHNDWLRKKGKDGSLKF